MYLVDTNIWLERPLDQARSEEAGNFLRRIPGDRLYLTGFTLHSTGIVLLKLGGKASAERVRGYFRADAASSTET